MFLDAFNQLPIVALIDDKILCMHGGLSPELQSLDQISNIARPTEIPENGNFINLIFSYHENFIFCKKNFVKNFIKKFK